MIAPVRLPNKTLDANEAVASVAYRLSEIISIYPITPSSAMAEHCDEWSAQLKANVWGQVPKVIQMQSEGGVAGTMHGTLMGGSLSTTFTASQGLLLMLPNMYKIAGELTPSVIHVSARALATHALSIFGDHSDVMSCRGTGWAMLASNNVQEAHDFAAIAHAATLLCRIPFLHFFDGFRTSHELNNLQMLDDSVLEALVDTESLSAFYKRGLTPDAPSVRGTAQNPDTFFQAREAINPYYKEAVETVEALMKLFGELTGREYKLFEYSGHPEAEEVIVAMGSAAETVEETVRYLNEKEGRRCGVLKVRLYRPFKTPAFIKSLPRSVKRITVLDRTKEPGGIGEPLFLDISTALNKARRCANACMGEGFDPRVIGGRYGLGSKEFTPAMVKAVFDNLSAKEPISNFSVGIFDDVSNMSLPYDPAFGIESAETTRAVFYGLGSDGTVGANKNTIKIIGEQTDLYTQAYFVYDSKKSGGLTVSHLRFGPTPIRAPYLVGEAQFVGCHQPQFMRTVPFMDTVTPGGTVLLNASGSPSEIWAQIPREVQEKVIEKKVRVFSIDAYKLAHELGLGNRINVIMQMGFFAISGLLSKEDSANAVKTAIRKTYGRKGPKVVSMNEAAVDAAIEHLVELEIPTTADGVVENTIRIPDNAPDFVKRVTSRILAGEGDLLPVSAFPPDGVWPTATSQYEKRNIAKAIPVWNPDACTQCNRCTLFCPHAAIRPKFYDSSLGEQAPEGFKSTPYKAPGVSDMLLSLQVSPEDCTGCTACVEVCPAMDDNGRRAIEMEPLAPLLEQEKTNWQYFLDLPQAELKAGKPTAKTISFKQPLFEFSGACSGCTQTPYVRILTQLYGDRLLMANATGCSSIYGGNLPTTPYCQDENGRGPAWANSLFEDNAEFGLGLHLSAEWRRSTALHLLEQLRDEIGDGQVTDLLSLSRSDKTSPSVLREHIEALKGTLGKLDHPTARRLLDHVDYLVKKTTWILGGDGWAYDIGFGGLDHVLASGQNVNIMVLDTEVYSNTGGQSSKATPIGAQAKFAAAGKELPKKDLGQIAMTYGGVYVGQIALGANERQALEVLNEAAAYDGPSLVIAYGPCLAHGIDLSHGPARQKAAVDTGYWPLYRFDPKRKNSGMPLLQLDSFAPDQPVSTFMEKENRFKVLERSQPEHAKYLLTLAQAQVDERWEKLERMSKSDTEDDEDDGW